VRKRETHTHTHKREREKERKREREKERERDPSNTRRAILPEKRDSEGKKRDDGLLEMVCWRWSAGVARGDVVC
jgi:hypothetical protein